MARILMKTTIPPEPDDWHIGRFSLLADTLRAAGHEVTAADRVEDEAGRDVDLAALDTGRHDQLWLFAVDVCDALSEGDCAAIRAFRAQGGGVMLARDHQDMGACLTRLGTVGRGHHFQSINPEIDTARHVRDDPYTVHLSWPNYHSGANGDFQKIEPVEPVHPILRRPDGSVIDRLPAHPHEGAVGVPEGAEAFAQVLARGRSKVTKVPFNIAVAFEAHEEDGARLGRAVNEATFHRFCDYNWDVGAGCPSFVGEPEGEGMASDPAAVEDVRLYVRNIAAWLADG